MEIRGGGGGGGEDTIELVSDSSRGSYTAIQREHVVISFHVCNQAHTHHQALRGYYLTLSEIISVRLW